MKFKEKQNVKAVVGSVIVEGIIVHNPETKRLCLASLDADILIPLYWCYSIEKCSRQDIKNRTTEQKKRAKLIERRYIKVKKYFKNI